MWKPAFLLVVAANAIYAVSTGEYDVCPAPCPPRRCGVDEALILCQVTPQPGDPAAAQITMPGMTRVSASLRTNAVTPTCQDNEVFSNCTQAICRAQDCSQKGQPIACASVAEGSCKQGCVCAKGYLRNSSGNCVAEDQCNETAVSCKGDPNAKPGCGINCGRLCSNYKSDDVSCIQVCYDDGCDCKEGYVLDEKTGKCVLPDQCTQTCPTNEVYTSCVQRNCGAQYCTNKYAVPCVPTSDNDCIGGCVCADSYKRLANGTCVPEDQCDTQTEESCNGDPNAKPGCGVNCGRLCSNYNSPDPIACPDICNTKGCDCKEGYVLDGNIGKCVLPNQCTPVQDQCNKPNEEYVQCPDCSPGTCESIGKRYNCPLQPADPSNCTGECRCKSGYYRNKIGDCITESQCLQCNGTNEYYSCGSACDNVCATLDQQSKDNCPIINIKCNEKCYCEDGYARDENNVCIPIEQCNGCKENERYVECPDAECVPQTCADAGFPVACPRFADGQCPSKPACICNSGYLRNSEGVCVPQNECPTCGGDPNARPGCGVNCGRLCSNYQSHGVACPAICNLNGCDCIEGYVLDTNSGKCVKPEQCTAPCGENEVYSNCINGGCDKRNCSQINDPKICIHPLKCEGGCVCQDGYLRNSNGVCIPQKQCTKSTPVSCGGDPNAKPGCGVNCGRLCSNYQSSGVVCSLVCKVDGCDCKKNYVFDSNIGRCVLPNQCTPTCQINEVFSKCTQKVCRNLDCTQKGQDVSCTDVSDESVCTNGCVCAENYLRAANGTCVPEDQCNECPEGETYSDCPPVYPKDCNSELCPRSRNDPATCPTTRQCGEPRCVCAYLRKRNRKTGQCVLASDCPPFPCNGHNEEYDSCPASCPGQNCSDYINNSTCSSPFRIGIVVPCKPACRCVKNHYRNTKGVCVSAKDCKTQCNKPNEIYHPCPPKCPPRRCDVDDRVIRCAAPPKLGDPDCDPGCICDDGFVRNDKGYCVTRDKCPSNNPSTGVTTNNADDNRLSDLEQGNTAFTGNFLYQVLKSKPGENLIVSPFSVLIPLAELVLYSSGISLTQLLEVFNLQDKSQVRSTFPNLINMLDSEQNNTLDLGARVYVNQDYQLTQSFVDDTALFSAKADTINVNEPNGAAAKINDWVSEITRGKIPDLVSPDLISPLTRLILANAIYFKGTWKTQFDPKNTKDQDFYISKDEKSQVKMMNLKGKFNYAEIPDIDSKVLQLPYVGGDISLIAILPNQIDGLVSLVDKLRDEAVFNNAINSLSSQTVTVSFPKMDISTSIDIKKILQQLNVTGIFESNSGLSGIITKNEPLYVTDAIGKASFTADEMGSEATAANAVIVGTRSLPLPPPEEYTFNADHPYVFAIVYKQLILFIGTFVK